MRPEDSCPICGEYISGASHNAGKYLDHRCPESTLNAINSANTRAINETENPDWNRTNRARLTEGFVLLNLPNRDE